MRPILLHAAALAVQVVVVGAAMDGLWSTIKDVLNPVGELGASSHQQQIKVIGAGLGRTGTGSLHAALQILGYRTYHFAEMLKDTQHALKWGDLAEGHATADEVIDMMLNSGFNATVDLPSADLFAEQLRRFPDSKVILSVRDSGEKWAQSWRVLMAVAHLLDRPFAFSFPSFCQWMPSMRATKKVRCWFGTGTIGLKKCELAYNIESDGWLAQQYEAHNKKVRAVVPAGSLLEFNVKDGWVPLCTFLKQPMPDVPFPHLNDSNFLKNAKMLLYIIVFAWIPCLLLVLWVVVYCCCCARRNEKSKTA